MKLVLFSDFTDYYDHCFDTISQPEPHLTYKRLSRTEYTRSHVFDYLSKELNLLTPTYGTVKEVREKLRASYQEPYVVVYHDERAHRGDGKSRMKLSAAPSDALCSVHIPSDSTSLRLVLLGCRGQSFWLKYQSNHVWKSNVGNVTIERTSGESNIVLSKLSPLSAIDFVVGFDGLLYAVDFNTAPQLSGTPLESVLDPNTIKEEIYKWMIEAMS
jgi:hypothetical protein